MHKMAILLNEEVENPRQPIRCESIVFFWKDNQFYDARNCIHRGNYRLIALNFVRSTFFFKYLKIEIIAFATIIPVFDAKFSSKVPSSTQNILAFQ